MSVHARLSASSAERFMACPGSVTLSELLPPEEDSEYAAEGTAAHTLAERCLREEIDAFMCMGEVIKTESGDFTVDGEMVEAVQLYVDYVRERSSPLVDGAELLIEHTLDNTGLGPDFGGTSDAVINGIVDGKEGRGGYIHVLDYKHGAGIAVDIAEYDEDGNRMNLNKQLMYYAFGVLRTLGVQWGDKISVGLTIVQPRAFHSDGEIREEWTDSDNILAWGEDELIPAMKRVDSDDTPFDNGEHCRFCPAKIVCPKLTEDFDVVANLDEAALPGFSDDELAAEYDRIATVKMRCKAIETECYNRAMVGRQIAGTKLGYGRPTRVWRKSRTDDSGVEIAFDDAVLVEFGDDALTDPEVKSPAQIEKLPRGKAFAGLWAYKEKGKPRLFPLDEKCEPYDPAKEGEGFAAVPQVDNSADSE